MDAEIIRKNGETYSFEDYGVLVKDFIVSSIPVESTFGEMEGRDGRIDKGARFGNREIRIPFSMKAYDLLDFPLLRDVLFELVTTKESFYLREKRRPKKLAYKFVDTTESPQMDESTNNRYIGGKRYLVRLQNSIEIEQVGLHGDEELIFETTELPYAESIGTSQDIQQNGIDANDELWGFGMGLIADDHSLIYTHTGTSFRIYNPGNVKVHPFQQELKITISNVQGSSSYLQLRNTTNGDTFRVTEPVSNSQTIVLDGANVTSNSLAFLRNTNRKFISLDPGWNEFQITGASEATVEFDFRFYYH